MRITGGIYRGRTVQCPKGVIRPAMDRMRESMFSILGDLHDLSWLDLFSGSGVVAIEAASRGAEPVVLVEADRGKRVTVEKNIAMVETAIRAYWMRAEQFLKRGPGVYDRIFLDPPFPMAGKQAIVEATAKSGKLAPDGILMIHHPSEEDWPEEIGGLRLFDTRKYGRSILRFFSEGRAES